MSNILKTWLDYTTLQMVAESYLDNFLSLNAEELRNRLRLGNNNPDFYPNGDPLVNPNLPGKTRLTDSQIAYFNANFEIVDHRGNDDIRFATVSAENIVGNGTGFSATLMRNRATGEYTLAIRSTEYPNEGEGGDWARDGINGADGELFNRGFAFGQLLALEAYYAKLKSSLALPEGAVLTVTGYSLGGHLAAVFAEAHPEVSHAYTFNGAGRGSYNANAGTLGDMLGYFRAVLDSPNAASGEIPMQEDQPGWAEYQAALGARGMAWPANLYGDSRYLWAVRATQQHFNTAFSPSGQTDDVLNSRITPLYGRASYGDSEWVANSGIHAASTRLFIEDQPDIQGLGVGWLDRLLGLKSDYGTTHSITLMADSLAVMELLQRLDPAPTVSQLYSLLSAGSNKRASGFLLSDGKGESDSLEKIVEALRKLVTGIDIALPVAEAGGGFGNLTNRNAFYQALDAISAALGTAPTGYRLVSLAGVSASELISKAEQKNAEGLAWRYALREGNPFALVKDDALYAQHNNGGKLDLYDSKTDNGALTEKWIEYRAKFLERKLYYNTHDARYDTSAGTAPGDSDATLHDQEDIVWDDRTGSSRIRIQRGGITASTRVVVFGSEAGETDLEGRDRDDVIFGGGGDDILKGDKGHDHLEGGAGVDQLEGGDGNDVLVGGEGGDTLTGGKNNDTLKGGAGADTYAFTSGDGWDWIEDADGLGNIRYDGILLAGGVHVATGFWQQKDPATGKTFTYSLDTRTENGETFQVLTIQAPGAGGGIRIKGWQPGQPNQLGITLGEAAPPLVLPPGSIAPATRQTAWHGEDHAVIEDQVGQLLMLSAVGDYGEVQGDGQLIGNGSDNYLYERAGGGSDELYGLGGRDSLIATGGNDRLFGGDGDDVLHGGDDDLLEGGEGSDRLFGDGETGCLERKVAKRKYRIDMWQKGFGQCPTHQY